MAMALSLAPSASAQVAGAPKRQPVQTPASSCSTADCHQKTVQHKFLHNTTTADCTACHTAVGDAKDHKFSLVAPVEELCLKCHQLPPKHVEHAPVRDKKCTGCHDPHGSDHKAELRGDLQGELCVKCHTDTTKTKAFVHGPVAANACTACHTWHPTDAPKALLAEGNALCLKCHEGAVKSGPDVHVHKAMEKGCVSCHDAHASDHKFQLKAASPELCLTCHKDQFDTMKTGATVIHGAINAEGGCTACHAPHSSKLDHLQRTNEPDTCLRCHDKPIKMPDGSQLTNMAALLDKNPEKHGPIRHGHCSVCHSPHASKTAKLLPAEYPATFYAPYSADLYALCFQCHSKDLATSQNGQGVTQFRDGQRNLHALHVNQEKGRTCRACHEVHASTREAHVRESVPYGTSNWTLQINFESTVEGGSCSPGCHATKKYTRPAAALPPPKEVPDRAAPTPKSDSAVPASSVTPAPAAATSPLPGSGGKP